MFKEHKQNYLICIPKILFKFPNLSAYSPGGTMSKTKIGITLLIMILLFVGCGEKKEYIHTWKFKSKTKDEKVLFAEFSIDCATKENYLFVKKKKNEIKRAYGMIFDDYEARQFDSSERQNQGKGTIYVVLRKIIKSRLPEHMYRSLGRIAILDYGITEKKKKKKKK